MIHVKICYMLLCGVVLGLISQCAVLAEPTLTPAQVLQISKSFCQTIGEPVTTMGTAQYPVPSGFDSHQFWQPRWYVDYPGQATLEVVDATGAIVSYYNDDAKKHEDHAYGTDGTAIPGTDALARATAAMQATGMAGELALDFAREIIGPHGASDHEWNVQWSRMSGDYRYEVQGAVISVGAEDGRLTGLSVNFDNPATVAASPVVTQDQASAITLTLLTNAGLQATIVDSDIEMAQPNTFWQDGEQRDPPGLPVLAWIFWFSEPGPRYGEVRIDAQTGYVIGGNEFGTRGGPNMAKPIPFGKLNLKAFKPGKATKSVTPPVSPLKETALRQALQSAEQGTLASAAKSGATVTTLSAQSNPKMLALLGKTTAWQGAKPTGAKVYRLTLTQGGTTRELTLFSSNVGLVGKGSEWYTVPTAFNAWVKTLGAPKTGK